MLSVNMEEYHVRILYLVLLAIATVVGNLLVLAAIVLLKSQRRSTNIFLASLAVADLLVGILVVPLYTLWTLKPGLFDDSFFMCGLVLLSCLLVIVASQLNLIVLSVEQFFAVCHPFRHRDLVLRFPNVHVTTSVFVWLSSFIATALSSLAIKRDFKSCSYYGMFDKVFLLLASLFGIFVPFIFIIAVNVKVLSVAKDHDRRRSSCVNVRPIKGKVKASMKVTVKEAVSPEYEPLMFHGEPLSNVEGNAIPVLQEMCFRRRHSNKAPTSWKDEGPGSCDREMKEQSIWVKGHNTLSQRRVKDQDMDTSALKHMLVSEYLNVDSCFGKDSLALDSRRAHLSLVNMGSGDAAASPSHVSYTKFDSRNHRLPECPSAQPVAGTLGYNFTRQGGRSHLVYPHKDVLSLRELDLVKGRGLEGKHSLRRLSTSADAIDSWTNVIRVSFTDTSKAHSGKTSTTSFSHTPAFHENERIRRIGMTKSPEGGRTLSHCAPTGPRRQLRASFSEHQLGHRVARTVALVCVSFVVAWLPIFVVLIINAVWARENLAYSLNVVVMVAFAKSTLNPFIYALCHHSFRRFYADALARLCFVKP